MEETEDGGQKTEDGGRRTEDGGQRTEDGGRKTEDGRQRTEGRGRRTEDRGRRTEGRAWSMGRGEELRIQSKGEPIRVFYAFDPDRRGVLLCAGNKTGYEKRFYEVMIPMADREFTAHLEKLKKE